MLNVGERQLSNTLAGSFCLDTLNVALEQGRPEIFNTDQGSQFTAQAFTGHLLTADIRISMNGRGRALDNIFVERLWRTVKYEATIRLQITSKAQTPSNCLQFHARPDLAV